jgi:hypothetical protein
MQRPFQPLRASNYERAPTLRATKLTRNGYRRRVFTRPARIFKRRLPLEKQGVPRGRTAEDCTLRDRPSFLQFEGVRPLCHDAWGYSDRGAQRRQAMEGGRFSGTVAAVILSYALVTPAFALTGSYRHSCTGCYIYESKLACKCRKVNGSYRHAGWMDYTKCPNQSVANNNGALVCGR